MEQANSELRTAEAKHKSLEKAYDRLRNEAASFLRLSLELKEMADQFNSTRSELETREAEIERRQKWLEESKSNFDSEMASHADERRRTEEAIESGNDHLNSLKLQIQDYDEELRVRESRFLELGKLIGAKERECDCVGERIKERTEELNRVVKSIEERSKEVEAKEKEVKVAEELMEECIDVAKVKERQANELEELIQERKKVLNELDRLKGTEYKLKSKERQLALLQKEHAELKEKSTASEYNLKKLLRQRQETIAECERELEMGGRELALKEKELDSVKQSTEELSQKLKSKDGVLGKQAKELELKEKELASIRKSAEEQTQALKSKDRQVESQKKELIQKKNELIKRHERIMELQRSHEAITKDKEALMKKECEKCKEFQQRKLNTFLREKDLEKRARQMAAKERQLDEKEGRLARARARSVGQI